MLTAKQEKFVQNLLKGMSQREAYRNAYPKAKRWKDESVDCEASKLFNDTKVIQRYNDLLKKAEDEAIMSAVERKKWLTKVIKGEVKTITHDSEGNEYENEAYMSDKMKAVDILNKMDGEYIEKVRLSGDKENPVIAQATIIDNVAKQMRDVNEDDVDVGINT